MKKKIEITELFVGKIARTQDGIVVQRRSKRGVVYRYVMRPSRGNRSAGQKRNSNAFKRAHTVVNRELRCCRVEWEGKYKACEGIYRGKHYTTVRGFVFAACYFSTVCEDEDEGE